MVDRSVVWRWLRVGLITLALGVFGLTLAALLLLLALQANPKFLGGPLEQGIGWALGRSVQIGELQRLHLGRDFALQFAARDLAIGNPQWAQAPHLVSAEQVTLRADLRSVWSDGPVQIRSLELSGLHVALLAPEGETPNWQFWWMDGDDAPPERLELPLVIHDMLVDRGEVLYRDPDQEIAARLDRLMVQDPGGSELINVDAAGAINGLDLQLHGALGPALALATGRGVRGDLSATWGELRVGVTGAIEDLTFLRDVDLHLSATSPDSRALLDLLGMPEIRDGPFNLDVRITDDDPGIALRAAGSVASFTGRLESTIANPLALDGVTLSLNMDGPSLAEGAAALELQGLPPVPYELTALVLKRGSSLEVRDGRLLAGDGDLRFSGELPKFPAIDDWQADVSGQRIELGIIAALLGFSVPEHNQWDLSLRLGATPRGRERVDVKLTNPSSKLGLKGVIGDGPGYRGTHLSLDVTTENLQQAATRLGVEGLPEGAFSAHGEVAAAEEGWRLSDLAVRTSLLELDLDGIVPAPRRPTRFDLRLGARTADLQSVLSAFDLDVDLAPAKPARLQARLQGPPHELRVSDATLVSGNTRARLRGTLGNPGDWRGLDVAWSIGSADLGEVAPFLRARRPIPLDLRGNFARHRDGWLIRHAEGSLASASVSLSGLLSDQPALHGSRLEVHATGRDLDQLLTPWTDYPLAETPFDLRLKLDYEPGRLVFREVQASIGSLDLSANLVFDEPPDLSASRGSLSVTGPSAQALLSLLRSDIGIADGPLSVQAEIAGATDRLRLERFAARIGDSDVDGSGDLVLNGKPTLNAMFHSRRLDLPNLFPTVEAGPLDAAGDLAPADADVASDGLRVIPDTPLDVGWLERIDGRLSYHVDELTLREGLSSSVIIDLRLKDGILASRELSWDGAFSSGYAQIVVASEGGQPAIDLYLNTQRIPMLWLLAGDPDPGADWTYLGRLWGRGHTVRELAAGLNGAIIYKGGGGRLNNRGLDVLLGDVVGEVFSYLNPQATKKPSTRVVCSAGAMSIKDGVVNVKPGLVLRLDKVDIASGGFIDLRKERVDLTFRSRSRKGLGISVGKAITPFLKIRGTLANPGLSLDAKSGAVSAGAAIATSGLSIIAGGLWDRWIATAADPCERLFSRASEGDRAEFRHLLTPPNVAASLEAATQPGQVPAGPQPEPAPRR